METVQIPISVTWEQFTELERLAKANGQEVGEWLANEVFLNGGQMSAETFSLYIKDVYMLLEGSDFAGLEQPVILMIALMELGFEKEYASALAAASTENSLATADFEVFEQKVIDIRDAFTYCYNKAVGILD